MKNLSFHQVWWAQKLFCYHFQIDYHQSKANKAGDALLRFFSKSQNKKEDLQAKNTQIFYCLQSLLTNVSLSSLSLHSTFSNLTLLY